MTNASQPSMGPPKGIGVYDRPAKTIPFGLILSVILAIVAVSGGLYHFHFFH